MVTISETNMKHIKIGTGYYRGRKRGDRNKVVGLSLLLITIFSLMFYACSEGIGRYFENQDKMLCESALISGNKEYTEKCKCYYKTNNIKCLQDEK